MTIAVAAPAPRSVRIAAIDWMRGLVMVLMVVDHASMAFDGTHDPLDSAMYPNAMAAALPGAEFFTRWMTHICAPTFVFLAGLSLALSVERKIAKGVPAGEIDRFIVTRGAFIALLDPTIVSLGSGRLTFQVLFAIGVSMICMAWLRRLPWVALLAVGAGWFAAGEWLTGLFWHPPGSASVPAAFLIATYGGGAVSIKYPVVPWLAMMALGWAFGKHISRAGAGEVRFSTPAVLAAGGAILLAIFGVVRAAWLALGALMRLEPKIGVRPNGPLLVFGQTSMFFYLAHRLAMEIPATYFGLRGFGDLSTTYVTAAVLLVVLYPACRWYRGLKAAHPASVLRYV